MAAVIQHRFRALITFDPSAPESLTQGYLDGTRTTCVIQPRFGMHFPAVFACREPSPPRPVMHVVLSIPLSSAETEAFFAAGRHFVMWADAIVGRTMRGDGLVSHGIISGQEAALPKTRRDPSHRRARPPTAGVSGAGLFNRHHPCQAGVQPARLRELRRSARTEAH